MPRALSASMTKNTSRGNKKVISMTRVRTGSGKPRIKAVKKNEFS